MLTTLKKHRNKMMLGVLILVGIITLAGCSANINLTIDPNPIQFSEQDTEETITVHLKTSGIGNVSVESLDVLILDETDDVVYQRTEEVNQDSFIVPGVEMEESFTIDVRETLADETNITDDQWRIFYEENLSGENYTLVIKLNGSITSTAEADIIFE